MQGAIAEGRGEGRVLAGYLPKQALIRRNSWLAPAPLLNPLPGGERRRSCCAGSFPPASLRRMSYRTALACSILKRSY